MRKIILSLFLTLMAASPAFAGLNVVATLPWIGSIAKEIGKDRISVTTLVKPSQDPHYLEAKPSMILAARKADIFMYNGLDLEIGYLPLVIEQSKNPRLMTSMPGNFNCSNFIRVIEKHAVVDRSMGDQHPLGHPHYHYSPTNVLRVAEGMSNALAGLDKANADFYRTNFKSFAERFKERQKKWSAINLKRKKFVAYHKLFEYLAGEFGFQLVGYIEAKPGIPPSAGHIEALIESMKENRPDGIITTNFYPKNESESIAAKTGVKVIYLPGDVGSMPGTGDYFSFMDKILAALQ
jgi:zinc/manganese transport system substrate-binding protein